MSGNILKIEGLNTAATQSWYIKSF